MVFDPSLMVIMLPPDKRATIAPCITFTETAFVDESSVVGSNTVKTIEYRLPGFRVYGLSLYEKYCFEVDIMLNFCAPFS